MATGRHLTTDGLLEIIDITAGMNPSGHRRYALSEIRRSLREVKA